MTLRNLVDQKPWWMSLNGSNCTADKSFHIPAAFSDRRSPAAFSSHFRPPPFRRFTVSVIHVEKIISIPAPRETMLALRHTPRLLLQMSVMSLITLTCVFTDFTKFTLPLLKLWFRWSFFRLGLAHWWAWSSFTRILYICFKTIASISLLGNLHNPVLMW